MGVAIIHRQGNVQVNSDCPQCRLCHPPALIAGGRPHDQAERNRAGAGEATGARIRPRAHGSSPMMTAITSRITNTSITTPTTSETATITTRETVTTTTTCASMPLFHEFRSLSTDLCDLSL